MTIRNLSPQAMFLALAREHKPKWRFTGKTAAQFRTWKKKALPDVLATLGDSIPRVKPNAKLLAEWEHKGLLRQRWIIDVQKHLSATLLVNLPKDLKKNERRPAIMCCHGHGPFGKEPVMGNDSTEELAASIKLHNYNYGEVMAQRGFCTYAIDWIGFGERNDNNKPNHSGLGAGQDWCNLYYLHATMMGTTSLAINVAHDKDESEVDRKLKAHSPRRDRFLDLVTLQGTLKLHNFEKAPADIVIIVSVPGKPLSASDDGTLRADPSKLKLTEREGTVRWRLTLEPDEDKTLSYKYERYVSSG